MSSPAQAPSRRRKPYDDAKFKAFHARHQKLDFTPDFNAAVEALIADDGMPRIAARALELYKLQAWGNQSDYSVHDGTDKTFTQADCARSLAVSRQRVSEADRYLISNGYLIVEGEKHYPVDDPAARRREMQASCPDVPDNSFSFSSPHFRAFRAAFFEAHAEERARYEESVRVLNQINVQIRSEYRASIASEAYRTTSSNGRIGHDENRTGQVVPAVSNEMSGSDRTDAAPILITETRNSNSSTTILEPGPEKPDVVRIENQMRRFADPDAAAAQKLIEECRQRAPDCTTAEIEYFINLKGSLAVRNRQIRNPVGFLIDTVPKCFEGESFRQFREQQRAPAASADELSRPMTFEEKQEMIAECEGALGDIAKLPLDDNLADMKRETERKLEMLRDSQRSGGVLSLRELYERALA